ncbi:MAG: hypothetical protein NE328_23825, partial [Lentisphaeraceae bacterium]|nr:hypothetical protein [Lentisphaeraceae bacterium]
MKNNSFAKTLRQSLLWAITVNILFSFQVSAQKKRTPPPTRLYTDPGAPKFTVVEDAKLTHIQLLEKEGNFVAGPKFTQNPVNKKIAGVPSGRIEQFSINSKDGTIYNPGIARKVFGTVDPNNPKTLIVETHEIDYKRTITVYIPANYTAGTEIPLMVTHDGPKKIGKADKGLAIIMDNLIAQKRIP